MKNFFSTLIAGMLIFISADIQAQNCYDDSCCMDHKIFYAEILGGANFLQTETRGGIKSDFKTGYVVSGSLGYRWCYGLRLEAEYAYRRNSLSKIHFFGRSFPLHGHYQSSSYLANLLWDIPVASWGYDFCKIQPFIGGGIGYDFQQIHATNDGLSLRESKKNFAWQVIAGLGYPLFCNTDISLEYKCHKGGFKYIYNHSLGVGLTYKFGLGY